ncbi:hypothetical protein Patl1_22442 [Pistacia atlantica]|uniref:Uncharacterized protein n=1 Tax=Pistacia atlantica TaxID=434234 RepID=A0ACC0ZXT3_9ROSI|nr:hypothetical protein Patl1_22442 [Pistacia atlantica]
MASVLGRQSDSTATEEKEETEHGDKGHRLHSRDQTPHDVVHAQLRHRKHLSPMYRLRCGPPFPRHYYRKISLNLNRSDEFYQGCSVSQI